MNDDTEVITPQWLDRLVARVMLPGVAAAGAMLYYPNNTIQHAGAFSALAELQTMHSAICREAIVATSDGLRSIKICLV